ncbi:MAG: hypothetical protein NT142_08335 [Planctomycetota bacterium]|nr:hypothetical protein [Planctomycetota bacterium]
MNISSLLTKATNDKLTKAEMQLIADAASLRSIDSYTATVILGRAFATEHRQILESLLHSPSDPMLARGAVYALCQCWDDTEKYLPELIAFCQGVAWDEDDDIRLISLSCGGEYLRKYWNQELAESLAKVAENESDDIVCNAARTAIARAMGLDHSQIPSPKRLLERSPLAIDDAVRGFNMRIAANHS